MASLLAPIRRAAYEVVVTCGAGALLETCPIDRPRFSILVVASLLVSWITHGVTLSASLDELLEPVVLVRGKILDVKREDAISTATVLVTHVFCGPKALKGA